MLYIYSGDVFYRACLDTEGNQSSCQTASYSFDFVIPGEIIGGAEPRTRMAYSIRPSMIHEAIWWRQE